MSDLNKLKELAQFADDAVTWVLLPIDMEKDDWETDVTNYIAAVSPNTLTSLIERLEATEAALESETNFHNDTLQGMRLWKHRAETAEKRVAELENEAYERSDSFNVLFNDHKRLVAELARRDKEAGEPVGEVVEWKHPTEERCVDFRWIKYVPAGTKLYTAAQPAAVAVQRRKAG